MVLLKSKLERALALVHAAIGDPRDEPLRTANHHAAEVLEELDGFALRPELRDDVVELTVALQTLKNVLFERPAPCRDRFLHRAMRT